MSKKRGYALFSVIKAAVKFFYPNIKVVNCENIPETDAIIVGNHCLMNGPICSELYLPENCYIWCAGQMMNLREVPEYAYSDFWSEKPVLLRPFYKMLSYIIAPFSVCIFNNARTVGVYHDMRILSTFKTSVKMLKEGRNLVIFPEKDEPFNNILFKFQDRFVDVAKLYYKSTGRCVTFVPLYTAPKLHEMYVCEGVTHNPENEIESERERICNCMSKAITDVARSLPEHMVVPYKNISKKHFLSNKDVTEVPK